MKKLLITLFLLISLVACTNNIPNITTQDPIEQYKEAVKLISEANSIDATIDNKMSFVMGDLNQNMNFNINIKTNNSLNPNDLKLSIDVIGNDNIDSSVYINDGFIYTKAVGQKFKMPIEEADDDVYEYNEQLNIDDYNPDVIKNLKSEIIDGYTVISYDVDTSGIFGINSFTDEIEDELDDANIKTFIAKGQIKLDNNNQVISNHISLEMEILANDISMKINSESLVTYNQINNVKIDLPEDLDNYKLILED